MRIGFDAKRVTNNATGLGNYSRYVVRVLAAHYPDLTLDLFSPSTGRPALYTELLRGFPNVALHTPRTWLGQRLKTRWRNHGVRPLLGAMGVDIFHGLSNEIPRALYHSPDLRTVVTIHDLAFIRHPEFYHPVDRALYTRRYGASARAADRVIAVSEFTKRELVALLGIDPERIRVIYQGCSPAFGAVRDDEAQTVRTAYDLPPRYMLFVGSVEARKNLKLAVEALSLLEDRATELVAVGRATAYSRSVEARARELGVGHRLRMMHHVPTEHLPGLYAGAELFVYPSRFEGFGIPLLEALNAGVPVIGARGSCLEEAGGPGSRYTDPDDAQELAGLMDEILSNASLREEMIAQGKRHAALFSDQRLAEELMALYQELRQA